MISSLVSYYLTLLLCICLGRFYKNINDIEVKRNYGTGLGILVTYLLCGDTFPHALIMVLINTGIILHCDRRYLHKISLMYTWIHLIYVYNVVSQSDFEYFICKMIAMRLVGMSFEVYIAALDIRIKNVQPPTTIENSKVKRDSTKLSALPTKLPKRDLLDSKSLEFPSSFASLSKRYHHNLMSSRYRLPSDLLNSDVITKAPSAVDIISYSLFFIGLHKGPYYRWKIFDDHFYQSFGAFGNFRIITKHKLKKALVCSLAYVFLQLQYNPEAITRGSFDEHQPNIRVYYCVPQFLMSILITQTTMLLCTSVFTEAGFGVYPVKTKPVPGHGPIEQLDLLHLAATSESVALGLEYNFSMLRCFDSEKLIFGPRMWDTVNAWDISVRYWFRTYIYRHAINANGEVRYAFTFLIWIIWRGPNIRLSMAAITVWVHMHLEEEFARLYNTTGLFYESWKLGFSIMRLACLIYLTPCIVLSDTAAVYKYYKSVNWNYHIVLLLLASYRMLVHRYRQYCQRHFSHI